MSHVESIMYRNSNVKYVFCLTFYHMIVNVNLQLKVERQDALAKAAAEAEAKKHKPVGKSDHDGQLKVFKSGIGKFVDPNVQLVLLFSVFFSKVSDDGQGVLGIPSMTSSIFCYSIIHCM
jgi:hypothetical protein